MSSGLIIIFLKYLMIFIFLLVILYIEDLCLEEFLNYLIGEICGVVDEEVRCV